MATTRYHVVLNVNSGTASTLGLTPDEIEKRFSAAGLDATVDADTEASFAERIARAITSDAEVIVAAGGDGTATALASAMVEAESEKSLAILPLGTANLLARDLLVPLTLDEWFAALPDMTPRRIDVGEVNGRLFLHKVVIGLMPGIAAGREQLRGRKDPAAFFGFLRYFFRRLARARRMAVEIAPQDGAVRIERVQAIAVANNAYDEGLGQFFHRSRLDRGTLGLYIVRHFTVGDMLRLSAGMVMGRWREDEALEIASVTAVTIRHRKPTLKVMFDGEVESLDTPMHFSIRPLALSIHAPAPLAVAADTAA